MRLVTFSQLNSQDSFVDVFIWVSSIDNAALYGICSMLIDVSQGHYPRLRLVGFCTCVLFIGSQHLA
jgi:hypothetical protein